MAAVGDYISLIRDRLVALHLADTAWAGTTAADRTKVRGGNYIIRDGSTRQNFKRAAGQALAPGDLPLADFRFMRLGPGPQQQNPFGTMKTFGNAAPAPTCGNVVAETLVYRVTYRALTEDQATALLADSQRIVTAARNQLANANASPALAALAYVTGAALTAANCVERVEQGQLLTVLDADLSVNVRLASADITG